MFFWQLPSSVVLIEDLTRSREPEKLRDLWLSGTIKNLEYYGPAWQIIRSEIFFDGTNKKIILHNFFVALIKALCVVKLLLFNSISFFLFSFLVNLFHKLVCHIQPQASTKAHNGINSLDCLMYSHNKKHCLFLILILRENLGNIHLYKLNNAF